MFNEKHDYQLQVYSLNEVSIILKKIKYISVIWKNKIKVLSHNLFLNFTHPILYTVHLFFSLSLSLSLSLSIYIYIYIYIYDNQRFF